MDSQFLEEYLNDFSKLIKPNKEVINGLIEVKSLITSAQKNGNKIREI